MNSNLIDKNIFQADNQHYASVAEAVGEIQREVASINVRMKELFSGKETTNEVTKYLDELDQCLERIDDLKNKVGQYGETNEDETVLKNILNRYLRVAGTFKTKAGTLEEMLFQKDQELPPKEIPVNEKVVIPPQPKPTGDQVQASSIIQTKKRKTMTINAVDQNDGDIAIGVNEKARQYSGVLPAKLKPSVVATVEKKDPINKAVPDKVPTVIHSRSVHEKTSLTNKYLNNPVYTSFIELQFTSPAAFERILDTNVTRIEAESTDFFERWLNETHTSPFAYMQDMTMREIEELSERSDIRDFLASKNIKYDTYVTWIDMIEEMQALVGNNPIMKFGELYARFVIESVMADYKENLSSNSQVGQQF